MRWSKRRDSFKLAAIVGWLVFTVAFALWWLKFSTEHIVHLAGLEPDRIEHWHRQKRMVLWEGGTWIVLLILGGVALIALVQKERARARGIREFFASFSHEIKTSLASLRIQAEALKHEQSQSSPILDRLVSDTVRLQLQLENSLFFASQGNLELYLEPLSLQELVERMREQWPNLKITLDQPCTVIADERALRTIFSNLLQNAIVHGEASEVNVESREAGLDQISISLNDNGKGFDGEMQKLGRVFHRPKSSSGSGLGLYICRILLRKMNGDLDFVQDAKGFRVRMTLEGTLP